MRGSWVEKGEGETSPSPSPEPGAFDHSATPPLRGRIRPSCSQVVRFSGHYEGAVVGFAYNLSPRATIPPPHFCLWQKVAPFAHANACSCSQVVRFSGHYEGAVVGFAYNLSPRATIYNNCNTICPLISPTNSSQKYFYYERGDLKMSFKTRETTKQHS